MLRTSTDKDLKPALEAFETALLTPIVSGELVVWSDAVRDSWAKLSPLVDEQLTSGHPKQYAEMTREDPEIYSRVDNLKNADSKLQAERNELDVLIQRLTQLGELIEPDERKFHEFQANLRKAGVDFVTQVRQQQVAVQTWYLEAFNRDRGFVD
jgi:hypothetical protein